MPIGIAYWPGGLEGNWSGLHPCRQGDRERLVSYNKKSRTREERERERERERDL